MKCHLSKSFNPSLLSRLKFELHLASDAKRFTPTHIHDLDHQFPGKYRYLRCPGVIMLRRGPEAIDRSGLLLPGVSRRRYVLGMQQRTAERICGDLQDHHGYRDHSHRYIACLSERMAAGDHSGI